MCQAANHPRRGEQEPEVVAFAGLFASAAGAAAAGAAPRPRMPGRPPPTAPGPPGGWRRFGGAKGRGEGKRQGDGNGFHFVYRALRGDGEIRARVVPEPGAASIEAGLVVRRDLTAAR